MLLGKRFETRTIKIVTAKDGHYTITDDSPRPRFFIDLSLAIFNRKAQKNKAIAPEKEPLCFEIIFDRVYVFCCPTHEDYVDWLCTIPLLTKTFGTFGYPLGCAVEKGKARFPLPIYRSLEYLMSHGGATTEGIFRTSASYKVVGRVKQLLDGDQDIELAMFEENAVAASIIKDYLRELPNPLIPFDFYDEFVAIGKNPGGKVQRRLREMLDKMPKQHQDTLWYLCSFCCDVVKHVDQTQMHPNNLAICLGPTVCRARSIDAQAEMENTKAINAAFELLLTNFDKAFKTIIERNAPLGFSSPAYPALIPHPNVPYDQIIAEIKEVYQKYQHRMSSNERRRNTVSSRKEMMESSSKHKRRSLHPSEPVVVPGVAQVDDVSQSTEMMTMKLQAQDIIINELKTTLQTLLSRLDVQERSIQELTLRAEFYEKQYNDHIRYQENLGPTDESPALSTEASQQAYIQSHL